ncbi:MAG: hypothetical protein K2G69_04005, partial [Muribaculaceae bacterium]|nr:hypothetical protein [Muribaculaceae bacterium]
MIKCLDKIFLMILILLPAMQMSGAKVKDTPDAFLKSSLQKEKVMEGEKVIYEVTLYSDDPDIAGAELIRMPEFSDIQAIRMAADNRLTETEIKGKRYYSVVIDRYILDAENQGRFKLQGGLYRLGFNRRVRVNDPFWGPSVMNRVEVAELKAPETVLKVGTLPSNGKPEDFSGAIGSFSIGLELPKGEIRAGQDILAVVTIEGEGDLTNTPAPDVRRAFREGLHFRNMTDEKQHFINEGKLGSEMVLLCRFTADAAGSYTILPVQFSYYDSKEN